MKLPLKSKASFTMTASHPKNALQAHKESQISSQTEDKETSRACTVRNVQQTPVLVFTLHSLVTLKAMEEFSSALSFCTKKRRGLEHGPSA